uniref:Uncharacterized protein n=1 Tax=Anguilla anguilla TaxID=7936 RepID=A0A0E9P6Y9_ANGAN
MSMASPYQIQSVHSTESFKEHRFL